MAVKSVRLEPGVTETKDKGGLAQLFLKLADKGKLVGIELGEGTELVRIFHRAKTYEAGPEGEWTFGQEMNVGDYLTVIARSSDGEVRVVEGAIALEGDFSADAPAPAAEPVFALAPPPPLPTAPTIPAAGSVTPGMNEVAVLLLRGDAEYLLRVIRGEMMNPAIAPAFERAFREALK